jgi:hypothetical protein
VIDTATGNVVANPVDGRRLNPAASWTSIDPAAVSPSKLQAGRSYAIRITSHFATTGAEVIPAASAGYDNVVLEASTAPSTPSGGGGGGNRGPGGPGGPGGPDGPGGTRFRNLHRLVVKTGCPKSLHARSCLIHIVALRHAFEGATIARPKTVRRRGHHPKTVSLRVKQQFSGYARRLARHHGRLPVHMTVAAHHRHRTLNEKVKTVSFH